MNCALELRSSPQETNSSGSTFHLFPFDFSLALIDHVSVRFCWAGMLLYGLELGWVVLRKRELLLWMGGGTLR